MSAAAATSTSLWPVPTVSSSTMSNPAASSTAAAAVEVAASPPAWPRDAIERMNTPSSGVGLHPDAVAQQGAAGDRRRRVHGDHGDRPAGLAQLGDQGGDERGLAGARAAR